MDRFCLNQIVCLCVSVVCYLDCLFGHTSIGESFALGFFFLAWTADESRVDWASQLEHVNLLEAAQHFGDTEVGSSVHCQV